MNQAHTDVLILGGGPAGAAAALMLLQRRPGLKVWIVEKSDYRAERIGETLPPKIMDLMIPLGIWHEFQQEGHLPAHGTSAVWGNEKPVENEFIFQTSGQGWHLDRNRFDVFLIKEAEKKGASVKLNTRANFIEKPGAFFHFQIAANTGEPELLQAAFVVDATGRAAQFALRMGAHKVRFDNLTGIFRWYEFSADTPDARTLVEATEDGWWYSAPLPIGKMAVAYLTDSDLAGKNSLREAGWDLLLKTAPHTQTRLKNARKAGPAQAVPAASQQLDLLGGAGWIAVGDAAGTFDPLSSQGIFKAMKSGIFGAYAVLDYLDGKTEALDKYENLLRREYESYLEIRAQYYQQEQRWPDRPFWQRRYDWLTLNPAAQLVSVGAPIARNDQARYRLSRREEEAILQLCSQPKSAREIVEAFKLLPFGYQKDRNIILGLQFLLQENVLKSIA